MSATFTLALPDWLAALPRRLGALARLRPHGRPDGEVLATAEAEMPRPGRNPEIALGRARGRLVWVALLFTAAFAIIALRLVQVMAPDGMFDPRPAAAMAAPPEAAADGASSAPPTPQPAGEQPMRGSIIDRNGLLLSASVTTYSMYADPEQVIDPAVAADKLAQALPGLDRVELLTKLTRSTRIDPQSGKPKPVRFEWLAPHLTPRQQDRVHVLGLPGIAFRREPRRLYAAGAATAHAVGFVDRDARGLAGLERRFDADLKAGRTVVSSIDLRVQHLVRRHLATGIERFGAIGGAGLVLDVRTGEVLAMVSLPDFDPHEPGRAAEADRFNRTTLGVFEMGSVFKLINTAAALDSGMVRLNDVFDATRPLTMGRFRIRDFQGKHRPLSVSEVLVYSSNIGSAEIARRFGPDIQRDYLARFGMMRAVPSDLGEVGQPIVPRDWRELTTMTVAYGHGISVTPMHMVSAVAAIANDGRLTRPTLLKRADGQAEASVQVIKPATSEVMRRLMRRVTVNGSAKKANAPGYLVGGKTGTAEKVVGGRYVKNARLTTFVGAFPLDEPRYAVLISLDEPKPTSETHGYATSGWNAAPTAGALIADLGPILGVAPRNDRDPALLARLALPGWEDPAPDANRSNLADATALQADDAPTLDSEGEDPAAVETPRPTLDVAAPPAGAKSPRVRSTGARQPRGGGDASQHADRPAR